MRFLTSAALLGLAIIAAWPATARAADWCGFHAKDGSLVRCGYSSFDECKQTLAGKNPVCIPNPEFAVQGPVQGRIQERSQGQRLALASHGAGANAHKF